ncbi:MAG: TRAP transporter large permease [Spirochaetota bacterium]
MLLAVLIVFIVGLVSSIPLAVTIGLAAIVPSLLNPGFAGSVQLVIRSTLTSVDNTAILAVPLFMLSGAIMAKGGISKKLFDVFAFFIGDRTAGIPIAVICTCLFYGAISGSGIATAAAVGGMTIPLMIGLGYDKVFAAALVATAGGLGVIIPPSIPYVFYGLFTGTSVGAMFTAGIIPGILIGLCLMGYAYIYCKRHGEDKEKIRANYMALRDKGLWVVFRESFWALLSPVIILGGIYSGIVTPTEAANISVIYALIVCVFIYKTVQLKNIPVFFIETVRSYAPLLILMGLAGAFGRVLSLAQAPALLGEFFIGAFTNKISFLLVLNIILLFLGMVMDVGPAVMILAPILLPTAIALGINPVHFGIVMVMNLAIGFVTPPFGVNLFVTAPLIKTPVMQVGVKAFPFVVAFIIALLLVTIFPAISLVLLG